MLLLAHLDELVAAPRKALKFNAGMVARNLTAQLHPSAHFSEHARIDRVGLGFQPTGAGKVACLFGIDAGMRNTCLRQAVAQRGVIVSRRFEHDEAIATDKALGQLGNSGGRIGQAPCRRTFHLVKNIEVGFCDIDSDNIRVYGHAACPHGARSALTASCNCSG